MAENIKNTKPHLIIKDGYFYMFDETTDMLLQKTDDGNTAFSYPLDTLISKTIINADYDGVFFWTMEDGDVTDSTVIRRWNIENYLAIQQQVISLSPIAGHKYNTDCFCVEHYHTTLSGAANEGTSTLYVDDYEDKLLSGMSVTVGPNADGNYETVGVQDVSEGIIELIDDLEYSYNSGHQVQFYTNIWLFNNYDGESSATGSLYKINAYTGSYITRYAGGAYKDISGCIFHTVSTIGDVGTQDMLIYVKSSNMLFVNIQEAGLSLPYYGSMLINTVAPNGLTVYKVYDLAIEGNNIYRLQNQMNIFGGAASYSTYNYQPGTLVPYVTSISIAAIPNIMPADGISTASIIATVKDQFNQPVVAKLVYFDTDDPAGILTGGTTKTTDSVGKAETVYQAGTTPREVIIYATVTQS